MSVETTTMSGVRREAVLRRWTAAAATVTTRRGWEGTARYRRRIGDVRSGMCELVTRTTTTVVGCRVQRCEGDSTRMHHQSSVSITTSPGWVNRMYVRLTPGGKPSPVTARRPTGCGCPFHAQFGRF